MKKIFKKPLRELMILALAVFLIITTTPFAYSQSSADNDNNVEGAPVTLAGEKLFVIQNSVGSFSPEERAQAISKRIETLADDQSIRVDSLKIQDQQDSTNIVQGNEVILSFTDVDAKTVGKARAEVTRDYLAKIQTAIQQYREERSVKNILFSILYAFITTLVVFILLKVLSQIFLRICTQIEAWRGTRIPALRIQNLELLPATQITEILIRLVKLLRTVLVLVILYGYLTLVFSFFPQTRQFGAILSNYLLETLAAGRTALVAYLPNLLIIALVIFVTIYTLQFIKFVFVQLGRARDFPWFYPEWAEPTYKLATFLIIAFAAVVVFPYLPGSKSPAFQGVSLFLGLLLSLGSSSAVANVVAGVILIYTRAFEIGDRVKINDAIGDIVEKSLLVTRIRTIKNVVITLPNATVLNAEIINYSALAEDPSHHLILHTTVTLGYDVPWRTVKEVLIGASLATQHILEKPAPFVLQTSLDDFYVSYELNAYTDKPAIMAKIYSELHENIQDRCNEVGIEILSPHYRAVRDGNQNTIPENYLPEDYTAPGFRISSLGNLTNSPKQQNGSNEDH